MWPFEKTKLAAPAEFPAFIDAIRDKLRSHGFDREADRLHELVHHMAWTTSNELYGELRLALRSIRNAGLDLPPATASEIRRAIRSIDYICRWR